MPALPPGHRDSAEPQGCGLRGPGRRLRANGACGQGTECGIRRPPSPDRCYSLAAWSATDTWCLRSRKASPPRGRASQRRSAWHSQRVQQTRLWEAFPVGKCPLSLRPRTSEGLASSPRQGPEVAVGKEGPQHSLPRRQGAGPLLPPPQPRRPDPVALSYLVQQELSLSATRGVTQGPAPAGQPPRGWRGDELLSQGAPRERSVQPALPGEAGWQESNSVVTGGPSACLVPHGSPFAEALRSVLVAFYRAPAGPGPVQASWPSAGPRLSQPCTLPCSSLSPCRRPSTRTHLPPGVKGRCTGGPRARGLRRRPGSRSQWVALGFLL